LDTCFLVILILVVTLTSTTFTFEMIVCVNNKLNLCYNHIFGMHMKMSYVVFDLVVLLLWLSSWFVFFFHMFPHCDSSSLCNICQSSLYYYVFSLMLLIWYYVVLKVYSLFLQ
jgi:hypothetical protein